MQRLSEAVGQQFVIDNRAGASGSIGADQVAEAAPDGYTLMVDSATHLANGYLYRKPAAEGFSAVAMIAGQPSVLVTHPSLPRDSLKSFIALANARPDQIN